MAKNHLQHTYKFLEVIVMFIQKDQRNKQEINLEKYLMINYSEKNKIYQLFDFIGKKCYSQRYYYIFNEKPGYESIKIIEFINNKTNKTNLKINSKIDKNY